ncbi:hypothetical protein IV102_18250 [bacterium]|nr:hypothetical protein [bacterium]
MMGYSPEVELKMQRPFSRLSEKEQRGYAAVEALKLGHGGTEGIEHRLFPHITRACQGVVFHSIEIVKQFMEKASTQTRLV